MPVDVGESETIVQVAYCAESMSNIYLVAECTCHSTSVAWRMLRNRQISRRIKRPSSQRYEVAVSIFIMVSKFNGSTQQTKLHAFFTTDFLQSMLYHLSKSTTSWNWKAICSPRGDAGGNTSSVQLRDELRKSACSNLSWSNLALGDAAISGVPDTPPPG